ncbi:MAG: hypothetical protein FJY95_03260 [Candidatus Handelsmanbacteria bacterium]|nr:hypothetical protein [Candidatus Handelsmanbacteria bacterium]
MRVAILQSPGEGLAAYVAQILHTWGLAEYGTIDPAAAGVLDPRQTPVLLCPAGAGGEGALAFARAGGTVVVCGPDETLARACGLAITGELATPVWLLPSALPTPGLAGELLPVVGRARRLEGATGARVLGQLVYPEHHDRDLPGVFEVPVGAGQVVLFAFDLPLAVLLLRQGDPDRAEQQPAGDCARPSHLAFDLGPHTEGWIPFADLLARLLVEVVRRALPGPAPLLWHLPQGAPGLVVYSGDEDQAEVAWNEAEFAAVRAGGGRMNLYLIPERTHSTAADLARYRQHHDLGPHPDLRPFDGRPVGERLAEFERQVRFFEQHFGGRARTLRNHCTAWAGYLEIVEVMARLGVGMEGNYFSGGFGRFRQPAPYAPFGAALPMRFCWPSGRLVGVYQQHTHLADDLLFGASGYSYKYTPAAFAAMLGRILADIAGRLHTPYATCIHPSNWVKFSGEQGIEVLVQAARRGMPVWSFDQWATFWEGRAACRCERVQWQPESGRLRLEVSGSPRPAELQLMLPARHAGVPLVRVQVGGGQGDCQPVRRYGEEVVFVPVGPGGAVTVEAEYTAG